MVHPQVSGILLMGGRGERFGSQTPKQLHRLSGEPVFIHTLKAFLRSELFSEIILVSPFEWMEQIKQMIRAVPSTIPIKIVPGGQTRKDSSYAGICSVSANTTHVVIHDAVRPFVSSRILSDNVRGAIEHGAVDTCISSADTIVYSRDGHIIDDIPRRSNYLRGQTPQSFELKLIKKAHENASLDIALQVTDDCSLVRCLGAPIHVVSGDESNIKITTELDLYLAEQILRMPTAQSTNMKTSSLSEKSYILTGATGAIGSSIEAKLRSEGAHVIPISLSSKEFPCDLSSEEEARETFHKIHSTYGPVDGLINCIGFLKTSPFLELRPEEINTIISSNFHAVLYSCYFAKVKPYGHIVNISSSSYSKGRENYAVYSACKAAIVNFTQALAQEMPKHLVNVICPQRTSSPMRLKNFSEQPLDMLLAPSDIASTVLDVLKGSESTGTIFEVKTLCVKSSMPTWPTCSLAK